MSRFEKSGRSLREPAGEAGPRQVPGARLALTQNGGGRLEGDSAARAVHILSAD